MFHARHLGHHFFPTAGRNTWFQPHIITCWLEVASALWYWRITDDLGLCEPLSTLDDVTGVLFDWIGSAIQYMAMADYPCALQNPLALALSDSSHAYS